MKVTSIHNRLINSISFSITLVTVAILLLTDIVVDNWIHQEHKRAAENKVNLLTTLVKEDLDGVEFDFAGEFMPEFEGESDPEYYQLWRETEIFEKSDTLSLFSINAFEYKNLDLGKRIVEELTLPDGRSGQIYYYSFLPQIKTEDRALYNTRLRNTGNKQEPMLIAYAISAEKHNILMWLVDISFLAAAIFVTFLVRKLVKTTVKRGLTPLEKFSNDIKSIRLADTCHEIVLTHQVTELIPIQESINTFISENKKLYLKEQRLTSDIAHELKTPIAELINLSEVSIKFPNDVNSSIKLGKDVLEIGQRLERIVESILLLHRYNNNKLEKNDIFDVSQKLEELTRNYKSVHLDCEESILLTSNLFAFEIIISNLLNNADNYKPINSYIKISCAQTDV
ncbi:hypothetical protein, partial [Paraglaciecola chathamensis]